jgi:hypothetical protein
MTSYPDIEGIEFDWFAIDQSGNVALFATAGAGFVPPYVFANREHYEEISEGIEASHWGSKEVWNDYATLGLYVYDWKLPNGPYRQERKPSRELDAVLKARIENLPSLPQLSVAFSDSREISVRKARRRTSLTLGRSS